MTKRMSDGQFAQFEPLIESWAWGLWVEAKRARENEKRLEVENTELKKDIKDLKTWPKIIMELKAENAELKRLIGGTDNIHYI